MKESSGYSASKYSIYRCTHSDYNVTVMCEAEMELYFISNDSLIDYYLERTKKLIRI